MKHTEHGEFPQNRYHRIDIYSIFIRIKLSLKVATQNGKYIYSTNVLYDILCILRVLYTT